MKFLQIKVPDNIHKSFKRLCFELDTDMSAQVRMWINDFLKKNGGNYERRNNNSRNSENS